MDTIAGLPQAVEAAFADAIGARDAALDAAASAVGALGPPDLCWLQRGRGAWQPGADPATAGAGGYYHSVLGAEAASGGAVSAYYARVAARLERPGTLQRFFQGDALDVQRVFYCAYDAISQRDMRCEICIPGGLVRVRGTGHCSDGSRAGRVRELDAGSAAHRRPQSRTQRQCVWHCTETRLPDHSSACPSRSLTGSLLSAVAGVRTRGRGRLPP